MSRLPKQRFDPLLTKVLWIDACIILRKSGLGHDEDHNVHVFGRLACASAILLTPILNVALADADNTQALARYLSVQQPRPDNVPYLFDVTYDELISGDDDGEEVELASGGSFRVNPAMPVGSRVTVLRAPEEENKAFNRQVEEFETSDDIGKLFWCGRSEVEIAELAEIPEDEKIVVSILSESASDIVFLLAPPEKIVLDREDYDSNTLYKAAKKAAKYLRREVRISLAMGLELGSHSYLSQGFRPAPIVKINSMDDTQACEYVPEASGSFRKSRIREVNGKAFVGINISNRTRTVISNLQPVAGQ